MKTLLVCDVEGTIFRAEYKIDGTDYASTMWQPLANCLGDAAIEEERETHQKWENKQYGNYADWVEATVKIHKKYGLHRDDFYALVNEAQYNSGVKDFFRNLDRNRYIPVLVSGGFEELIAKAMRELGVFYGFGACEYFFDDEDGYLSGYRIKHCDFEDKFSQIEKILKRFELHPKTDWVFVGDGKNDIPIARRAPLSFGINAHPELAKVVNHEISCFSEIPDLLQKAKITPSVYLSREDELLLVNKSLEKINKEINEELKLMELGPSTREARLCTEVHNLRKQLKKLKEENNALKGSVAKKLKQEENHFLATEEDYELSPENSLRDILNQGYRVVFFGFHSGDSSYQYFSNYHKNLVVKSGFDESYNQKSLKMFDFIFEFISKMSHDITHKNNSIKKDVPYSQLRIHQGNEKIENAMANILCRYIDSL